MENLLLADAKKLHVAPNLTDAAANPNANHLAACLAANIRLKLLNVWLFAEAQSYAARLNHATQNVAIQSAQPPRKSRHAPL